MNMLVSRRAFLKGSAAMALAVATSGLLAGCSGSSANEVTLGDFKVDVTNLRIQENGDMAGKDQNSYVIPQVKITNVSGGGSLQTYSNIFVSAAIGGTELRLSNGGSPVLTNTLLPIGSSATATPKYATKDQALLNQLRSGTALFTLRIRLSGATAVYTINYHTGAIRASLA